MHENFEIVILEVAWPANFYTWPIVLYRLPIESNRIGLVCEGALGVLQSTAVNKLVGMVTIHLDSIWPLFTAIKSRTP